MLVYRLRPDAPEAATQTHPDRSTSCCRRRPGRRKGIVVTGFAGAARLVETGPRGSDANWAAATRVRPGSDRAELGGGRAGGVFDAFDSTSFCVWGAAAESARVGPRDDEVLTATSEQQAGGHGAGPLAPIAAKNAGGAGGGQQQRSRGRARYQAGPGQHCRSGPCADSGASRTCRTSSRGSMFWRACWASGCARHADAFVLVIRSAGVHRWWPIWCFVVPSRSRRGDRAASTCGHPRSAAMPHILPDLDLAGDDVASRVRGNQPEMEGDLR